MVARLVVNISKKIPGPAEYSSTSASCSIESECQVDQAVAEAARLYAQAERAVDTQLGLCPAVGLPAVGLPAMGLSPVGLPAVAAHPSSQPSPQPSGLQPSWPRSSASPSSSRPAPARRGMPLATASQLKLLGHLLSSREGQATAILHHYQVTDLSQLTVKQASETIDTLKAEGARR